MGSEDLSIRVQRRKAVEDLLSAGNADCLFQPKSLLTVVTYDASGNLTLTTLLLPEKAATVSAPAYVKGAVYFDTTLNKLMVGGATAWETVTSV